MDRQHLAEIYGAYIDCLNRKDWGVLSSFVSARVRHNDRELGLSGYQAMLEQDYRDIPDLTFKVDLLVCDPPLLAARLRFDCSPRASFMGLPVNGRLVSFTENVFYRFEDQKIEQVFSVIDQTAIAAQLVPKH